MSAKLTYNDVKLFYESQGCELLEDEYINNQTKMKFRCNCGRVHRSVLGNFKQGQRCPGCGVAASESQRLTYTYVKAYYKLRGCELLEDEYINNQTKMKFRCNCGRVHRSIFGDFKRGRRCRSCGMARVSESKRFTYAYVKAYYESQGCKLLEDEYVGCYEKMKFRCNCGRVHRSIFKYFRRGMRCPRCRADKVSDRASMKIGCKWTLETVAVQLKAAGIEFTSIGHTERRSSDPLYFNCHCCDCRAPIRKLFRPHLVKSPLSCRCRSCAATAGHLKRRGADPSPSLSGVGIETVRRVAAEFSAKKNDW